MVKMKRFTLIIVCFLAIALQGFSQRVTDKLDRGLIAVPASSGNLVSWRIFAEEYYGVTYNLYANGSLLKSGLTTSNFQHTSGSSSTKYQVEAVVNGEVQEKSAESVYFPGGYKQFAVAKVQDRKGNDVTSQYIINDISLGDVDGDGVVEFLVKRNYTGDILSSSNTTCFHHYECYNLKGERLWWIDLGPNMISGPDEQYDIVLYDWDQDGKAEALMRGVDNMIIYTAIRETIYVGSKTVDTRSSVNPTVNMTYTNQGNEYLLYLNGLTGMPYEIGSDSTPYWIPYPLPRGDVNDWGDGYGHRATKHYFGAPFLDGRNPYIFLGRGCYTKHHMKTFRVDPATHELSLYWEWSNNGGWADPWYGNGYHNFGIADVDEDGRDEIVFGSMIIDDNGQGLSTTGLGHGDAQHCGDFDPYRKGLEFFACNEDEPNNNYRNATTSKIYYRSKGTGDDGRGLMGNFSNSFPGCMGRSVSSGLISSVADKEISGGPATGGTNDALFWSHLNFRIYWTGDLVEGVLDSPGEEREAVVWTTAGGRVFQSSGCKMNNGSKNNPCATGDIFGDWREEIVLRTTDNAYIRIYSTPISTSYRIPTLWHDHQYRNAMVWQPVGYNQPPHTSFFLGQMEGITVAPPPYTMTGRVEIPDNGTISAANNNQHVLVCETNDTHVTIEDGASPFVATFNVPSWVQGTNSSKTDGTAAINYDYYTCTVTGGAFTGGMTLAKQGDGILTLPSVAMDYTGPTNVWAGTLNFDGTLLKSSLWLNRHTTLNTNGGQFRSIKADYAATICPTGSLTVDTLTLGFGSRLKLNAYSDGFRIDQINANVMTVEAKTTTVWKQYGPAYLTPVLEVVVHDDAESSQLAIGKYFIGEIGKVSGNISNIKIEGISGLKSYLSLEEDGKLYLVVEGIRDAGTVYWTGSKNTTWNYADALNFQNIEGEEDIFVSGDKVVFDDAASRFTVALTGDLDPDSVIVDNTKAYTFNGYGAITGNATFVKRGTGVVTMSNDNTFTGGVLISGGTVRVSYLSNDNKAKGNLGAVNSSNMMFIIENGGTLQTTAAVETSTPIRVRTPQGGVINNSADFVMNKAIIGTRLTKKGSGWFKTYTSNTALDTLCLVEGTLNVTGGCTTAAKLLELQGGNLVLNNNSSVAMYVPEGKTTTITPTADRGTYSGKLTGSGTVTISYPLVDGKTWYADRCSMTGDWSKFEGTVNPVSGIAADGRFCLNTNTGLGKGTMNIASGVIVQNTGKAYAIGALTGAGTLGGICTLGGSAGSLNTWTVGGTNKDFTFSGTITGASAFTKAGTGKMTFSGSGDFTGTCRVNAGELCLNSSKSNIMLGSSSLTVVKGATLCGTGTLGNPTISVATGAIIRSGIAEDNAGGNLKFSDKTLIVNGTAQTYIANKNSYSKFTNIGTLKLNGKLVVRGAEGLALSVGDEIQIFDASTITLGNDLVLDLCEPNRALGLTWDTSRLSEGILVVAPVPDAIMSLQADELRQAEIYTLAGQRLMGKPTRPGVYVIDGKKTLLRR